MKIEKLNLWSGRFELIRIGNMRFERCEDRWTGFLEYDGEEIPIFAGSDEGFTLDQIRSCYRDTGTFLGSIENRMKIRT